MKIARQEKKALLKKLTPVIKAKLLAVKSGELTYTEVAERTNLTASRISEVVNDRKDVNEIFLRKLLVGGIISIDDLPSLNGLDQSEKDYLMDLTIYEDTNLRDEVAKLKSLGEDPARILRDFRFKKYPESVEPV